MPSRDKQAILSALQELTKEMTMIKEIQHEQHNQIEELRGTVGRSVGTKSRSSKTVTDIQTAQLHNEMSILRDSQNKVFDFLRDLKIPNPNNQIIQMQNDMQELCTLQTEIISIMDAKHKRLTDSTMTKMQDELSTVHSSQLYLNTKLGSLKSHVTDLESQIQTSQKSISHSELTDMHSTLIDMLRFRDNMIGNIGTIEANIYTISAQNTEANRINTQKLQDMQNDIIRQSVAICGHFHDLYTDVVQCVGIVDAPSVDMIKMAAQRKATTFAAFN